MALELLGEQMGRNSVQLPSQPSSKDSLLPIPSARLQFPPGHSQLQRPKAEEHDSWARSSLGMCLSARRWGAISTSAGVSPAVRVTTSQSCPPGAGSAFLVQGKQARWQSDLSPDSLGALTVELASHLFDGRPGAVLSHALSSHGLTRWPEV